MNYIPRLFQSVDTQTQHKGNAMPSLILHTAIADALGECFQLLAQSLKAVLIEAVERWMVPLRNSLDHFGARMVLVVLVVDNNAAVQSFHASIWDLRRSVTPQQYWFCTPTMRCFRSPVLSLQKRQAPICGFRPCLYPGEWVSDSLTALILMRKRPSDLSF